MVIIYIKISNLKQRVLKEVIKLLEERKKKVLKAIVEQYINTAEPVSSNAIAQNYDLNYSSATIRNEMSDLEKIGLLEKTHISSGRIPSEKGYRYYVDELVKDDNISREEIKYISDKLETKVNEIEDLTKITANTISEVTHYTTVSIGPKANKQIIDNIKFVLLSSRMMLAIILTDMGLVKETIIKFDEDINEKQVETMNYMFNNKLKGQPIETIDRPLEEYLYDEMTYSVKVIKPVIEQIKKVLQDEQIYLEGANKSFDLPEFNSLEVAKNFVNILDQKELVEEVLKSGLAEDINVYIGEENQKDELKDFSVVTFKHKVGNKDLGTIGIIGPKRMDYSKVISVMKYINKKLKDIE
jgi:heat-inducible transcriptional repressor